MNQSADPYFALIAPACVMLFGLTLAGCWWVQRRQPGARFLLWLAAGYVVPAVALAAQSLMSNAELARAALFTGGLYLGGSWAQAQGMALRLGSRGVSVVAGLLVAAATLGALYYYSQVQEDLWVRVQCLTVGTALQQLLVLGAMLKAQPAHDWLERWVRWTYGVNVGYALLRPFAVWLLPVQGVQELTRSGYWLLTLAVAVLIGMWFALGLLACSVRDVLASLREERNRDPLTRLLNRRAFLESSAALLADQRQAPWMLVAMDIDHFKQINDRWGHGVGDHVLQELALLLPRQVRDRDLVARYGGEEFVLLLSRVQLPEAKSVVERIRESLHDHDFPLLPAGVKVTASFGIAPLAAAQQLDAALELADALLYAAKRDGRDCVRTPERLDEPQDAPALSGI
ncbi:MAG: GGDEF domain-containing protein [Comamonas sp.]|nr:GGDEF domain-containing protein [Comamonas sp.]